MKILLASLEINKASQVPATQMKKLGNLVHAMKLCNKPGEFQEEGTQIIRYSDYATSDIPPQRFLNNPWFLRRKLIWKIKHNQHFAKVADLIWAKAYPMISVLEASDLLQAGFPYQRWACPMGHPLLCVFVSLHRCCSAPSSLMFGCPGSSSHPNWQSPQGNHPHILSKHGYMVVIFTSVYNVLPLFGEMIGLGDIFFVKCVWRVPCSLTTIGSLGVVPCEEMLLMGSQVGSGKCKAGIAGEEHPSCVFPSIVGRPKTDWTSEGFIGNGYGTNKCWLSLCIPTEN